MIIPWVRSTLDLKSNMIEAFVEMAGVSKDDLKVTIKEDGFCVIYPEEDGETTHRCYPFEHEVKIETAKAEYKAGLLDIRVSLKDDVLGKELPLA